MFNENRTTIVYEVRDKFSKIRSFLPDQHFRLPKDASSFIKILFSFVMFPNAISYLLSESKINLNQ